MLPRAPRSPQGSSPSLCDKSGGSEPLLFCTVPPPAGDGRLSRPLRPSRRVCERPRALRAFASSQFLFDKKRFSSLDAALASGPGCIDLFSGSRNLPRSLVRAGFPWVLCFDVAHSPDEDLLSRPVRARVEGLIRHGFALVLTAGPVCASFSRAVTPPCRTTEHPLGVPWCSELQRAKCDQGNSFAWCRPGRGKAARG